MSEQAGPTFSGWSRPTKYPHLEIQIVESGPFALVGIRHSDMPSEAMWFTAHEWTAFLKAARSGDLDLMHDTTERTTDEHSRRELPAGQAHQGDAVRLDGVRQPQAPD